MVFVSVCVYACKFVNVKKLDVNNNNKKGISWVDRYKNIYFVPKIQFTVSIN